MFVGYPNQTYSAFWCGVRASLQTKFAFAGAFNGLKLKVFLPLFNKEQPSSHGKIGCALLRQSTCQYWPSFGGRNSGAAAQVEVAAQSERIFDFLLDFLCQGGSMSGKVSPSKEMLQFLAGALVVRFPKGPRFCGKGLSFTFKVATVKS